MPKIIIAGEDSVLIYFGNKINALLPAIIQNFSNQLKAALADVIIDTAPSYTSLQVRYDLNKITHQLFVKKLEVLLNQNSNNTATFKSKTIDIPVYYGIEVGLDLERLLAEKNLDLATFIKLHTEQEVLVYAIGFSPMFAFLGEIDARIQAPRLATPRIKIPAGSVGIAERQTAIYPSDSSAGWNIIGRTPLDLSLKNANNINKFCVGDSVKFHSITYDEYLASGGLL